MSQEKITRLNEIEAPYGRKIVLEEVLHESGLRVMRVHIREGNRFTVLDLDDKTAARFGAEMVRWAADGPTD